MKVAVVHDWLYVRGGAERVLEQILALFPEADLFSLIDFYPPEKRRTLKNKHVTTSFIQNLPFASTKHQMYLPLMPIAIEQFDLGHYDLIISSSYAVAKGVITGPDQLHISYVHSPMRYAWDLQHQYLREAKLERGLRSVLARFLLHQLRMWDLRTANGVDHFVANSAFVARRIWKVYRRKAKVIYPPVATDNFRLGDAKEDFYLTVSRLVPYKRTSLIVDAFLQMPEKTLVVIGDGPDSKRIRAKIKPNIKLLGHRSDEEVKSYMRRAKAFVFAAEEDFGIVPVEAQACGTPVIAFGKGGVRETVIDIGNGQPTGVLYYAQTAASLVKAVARFESCQASWVPSNIRANALRFSEDNFRRNFRNYVEEKWTTFQEK